MAQTTSLSVARSLTTALGWFGFAGVLGERPGTQLRLPVSSLVDGIQRVGVDGAMQISTVWACADRRAAIIASLPFFAYDVPLSGPKTLAYGTRLYSLLHDSPNSRMTPFEFWRAMILNHDLRGNGYARIVRAPKLNASDPLGEAIALWPMPADQVEEFVDDTGAKWFLYTLKDTVYVYAEEDVLHLKNLGNGSTGMSKLEFMATALAEARSQALTATKTFANGGKPTAVLMTDKVLSPVQRAALQNRFAEMAHGSESRLFVLEADMSYQQLSATPEQLQLAESRSYTVEELCRFMDVPPVLVYHSNVTAWGTGIDSIVAGWYKTTIGPLTVSIQQAVRKRVLTPRQQAWNAVEYNLDALLRADAPARFALYATAVQNGLKTRDEVRQLENDPPAGGMAAKLTAQSNLVPLDKLGTTQPGAGGGGPPIAQ